MTEILLCFTDPDYVFSGCHDFQKCIAESFKAQAEFVSHVMYTCEPF
jgi:hypothetical protein